MEDLWWLIPVIVFLITFCWSAKPKPFEKKCPMCGIGPVMFESYGCEDTFTKTLAPCKDCGYEADDFTEDVLWPPVIST